MRLSDILLISLFIIKISQFLTREDLFPQVLENVLKRKNINLFITNEQTCI